MATSRFVGTGARVAWEDYGIRIIVAHRPSETPGGKINELWVRIEDSPTYSQSATSNWETTVANISRYCADLLLKRVPRSKRNASSRKAPRA